MSPAAAAPRAPTPTREAFDENAHILLAAGDIGDCGSSGDEATAAILDANPEGTVVTLGDNAYPDGREADFDNCYEPSWGRHKARTKAAVGNHEYQWFFRDAWGHYEYFGEAGAGPWSKYFHSFEIGDWHVVVLNSMCSVVSCAAGSEQEQWLRADLAASQKACTAAVWHHPRFSSGSLHGDHAAVEPLWRALYEHGAELVLSGHDHHYERFAPMSADGVLNPHHGLREFVVGTGGSHLRPLGTVKPNSEVRDATAFGVLKLSLRAGGYDWQFLPQAGRTFTDTGSGSCHDAPGESTPPGVPSLASSHGTEWSNDRTVDVTWSGASDSGSGVDGFSYEWSQSATTVPDTTKELEENATGTTSSPRADGLWWFHLRTGDNAGNWSGTTRIGPFRIDTTPPSNPALSFSHTQGAWSTDASVGVSWSGSNDASSGVAGHSYEWSRDASTVPDGTPDTSPAEATLPDGDWWFHLRTRDHAGNLSDAVHAGPFRIDTVPPGTTDDAPADWRAEHVTVTLTPLDDRSGVATTRFRTDGGPFVSGTTVVVTEDGVHRVEYSSTDLAGNAESLRSATVGIDQTPPPLPAVSSTSHAPQAWSNDPTIDVTWSATDATSGVDGFSGEWTQSATTLPAPVKDAEETGAAETSPALADGDWWFHLRARDNAGNWGPAEHYGPFRIDTTAPTNPALSSPSHVVGTWSADRKVVIELAGGDGAAGYSYAWSPAEDATPDAEQDADSATTRIESVRPDGSWWFHLRSVDAEGRWTAPTHLGPFRIDGAAPETTIVGAPPISTESTDARFEFLAGEEATFECALDGAAFTPCSSPWAYAGVAVGEHVFEVRARDRAANVDLTPALHRWTVTASPPPPPPPSPPPPPPPPAPPSPQRPPKVTPKVTICFRKRTITVPKKQLARYKKRGAKVGRCKPPKRKVRRRAA